MKKSAFNQKILSSINTVIYIINFSPYRVEWIANNPNVYKWVGFSPTEIVELGIDFPKRLLNEVDFTESVLESITFFKAHPDSKWIKKLIRKGLF